MKTRTEAEVLGFLDDEFAWRRKELTQIWADVNSESSKSQPARIRGGTALLYAHWEGFVKVASDVYVDFVSRRRLSMRDLNHGFFALALRTEMVTLTSADSSSAEFKFAEFILGDMKSRARIPKLGVIKTGSNLNAERLKKIVLTLGLDYAPFELKENLIDCQLLNWRNEIAHGRSTFPSLAEFTTLYEEVSAMLRIFKDQIANAVTLKRYTRHSDNRQDINAPDAPVKQE